jgi:hypothetical protein
MLNAIAIAILAGMMFIPIINLVVGIIVGTLLLGVTGGFAGATLAGLITIATSQSVRPQQRHRVTQRCRCADPKSRPEESSSSASSRWIRSTHRSGTGSRRTSLSVSFNILPIRSKMGASSKYFFSLMWAKPRLVCAVPKKIATEKVVASCYGGARLLRLRAPLAIGLGLRHRLNEIVQLLE